MAKYCTECGTKVTPSMKYCPECGKKISKRSQNKSKKSAGSKDKKDSSKKKTKTDTKKTKSKNINSKTKKKRKKNKNNHKILILGSILLFLGIFIIILFSGVLSPNTDSNILNNNTDLIKISPKEIQELTNKDIASKEGYFCKVKSDNKYYYIKKSEIISLNGLNEPFLAKVKLKKLDNNDEIYAIYEVYDLNGNKL